VGTRDVRTQSDLVQLVRVQFMSSSLVLVFSLVLSLMLNSFVLCLLVPNLLVLRFSPKLNSLVPSPTDGQTK
jgi:hypothetical protein